MSRQHDALLKRICGDGPSGETLERARAILHTTSIKTAPGSGYDLGEGASGLPAICAYLAAEQTGDSGITEKTAQVASCLRPRLFKTTLNTVRSALAAAQTSTAQYKESRKVTYKDLVDAERIGRKGMVIDWMQSAEHTLMKSTEMRRRFSKAYDAITVAVFCWTAQHMNMGKVDPARLRDAYDVPQDMFDELVDALHEVCTDVAKIIKAEVAALRLQRTPSKALSPSKVNATPSKQITLPPPLPAPTPSRTLTRSPSKSSLRAPSVDLSPRKTPSHKRKVAFDGAIAEEDEEDFDALATPSKRQKFSSPLKEMLPSTSSPRSSSRLASIAASAAASRATQEMGSRDSNPFAGPSTPRRPRTTPQPSSTHSMRSVGSSRSRTTTVGSAPSTPSRRHALPTVREAPEVPRRRFRPVFADQQQWLKGDARLERELRPWAEKWRNLVKKAGGDVWKAAALGGSGGPVIVAS